MNKRYDYVFVVEGSGQFPLDMLRRDKAHPLSESDANRAQHPGAPGSLRRVTLERVGAERWWTPTVGRWESFGFRLVALARIDDRGHKETLIQHEEAL